MTRWLVLALAALGCDPAPDHRAPPSTITSCRRAFGEKLGVPFVRVCPADLPEAIAEPFWIAAAPIGCTAGGHETIGCPPIVALAPLGPGAGALDARPVQLVDADHAHRTCTLRFGGRLPTTTERARARDALGLATVLVTETDAPAPSRHLEMLPEWTTDTPCLAPAMLDRSCRVTRFPADVTAEVAWSRLRACRATPAPTQGALAITPPESCPVTPPPEAPHCLVVATRGARLGFTLACRALGDQERVHPAATAGRAAFRCVVPEAALTGTIVTP